jgi:hypothetical protein
VKVNRPTDFIRFTGEIKKIVPKIDVVGDKVATITMSFMATDENLAAINSVWKPETNVEVCMRMIK